MHAAWVDDYPAFAAYADAELGPRPIGMSIDRIDNNAGYVPGNLRWATYTTQNRNRRSSKLSQADVDQIRQRYAEGTLQKVLAKQFGVTKGTVCEIIRGHIWA